ncbi:MAG: FG-GAP repeat domain-containing protein [Myxococcota bacterium]
MRLLLVGALALSFGCSDQNFRSNLDGNDPDGDGGGGGGNGDGEDPVLECKPFDAAPAIDISLNDACDVPPAEGGFTPVVEWNVTGNHGYGPPVVGQLNDDNGDGLINNSDMPSICYVQNNSQGLICMRGDTGQVEFTTTGGRGSWDGLSGLAIGDVDGDGVPEIAVANGPSSLTLFSNEGDVLWTADRLSNTNTYFSYPSIADLDGDGLAEIILGRVIMEHDGRVVGTGNLGSGAVPNAGGSFSEGSVPVPVDLDGDGELEVVVGNAAYRKDGSTKYSNSLSDGCVAVADMDLDGEPEVIIVSGNRVYTAESDMSLTGWSATFASNYIGPPAIDDLDGDGYPEFVVQAQNTMRAYRWDGSILWTASVNDYSGAAGVILFDFELDGYPEVIYADETHVRVFNGRDGTIKLSSSEHASYTGFETPVVADVDGDSEVEIVMLHGHAVSGMPYGISVYGDADHSWPQGRSVWNQHAYSITNVNDDLSIPSAQPANWDEFNNFRSADGGLPPSTWNDLQAEVVEVCTDECPKRLLLQIRVRNAGTQDITGTIPIVVRAGEQGPIIARTAAPGGVVSGRSTDGIEIEVNPADLGGAVPWVEVDINNADASTITECDEDNNRQLLSETCDG